MYLDELEAGVGYWKKDNICKGGLVFVSLIYCFNINEISLEVLDVSVVSILNNSKTYFKEMTG